MSDPPRPEASADLGARLEALGRALGSREAEHAAARAAGAPHLRVELSEIRVDDKHLRALEFDLVRGRHGAVVRARSHGDVRLEGPLRVGKTEGPCRSFAGDAAQKLESALADLLERFLEEAAAP
jgi:hypothetical protein